MTASIFVILLAASQIDSKSIKFVMVQRVIDGATIEIVDGDTRDSVRMIGIDAPELKKKINGKWIQTNEPCARDAADFAAISINYTGAVMLESDPAVPNRDKSNRLLRHVWTWVTDRPECSKESFLKFMEAPEDNYNYIHFLKNIGEALLRTGVAKAISDARHSNELTYQGAEAEARQKRMGLWYAPGGGAKCALLKGGKP